MNLLLDTNILIQIAKHPSYEILAQVINPNNHKVFVSIVSIAELKSIALQNKWGDKKLQAIAVFLSKVTFVEINENLANTYAEIDAFSQCRNPAYKNTQFSTPRNMGKNDLWIASTAALLGLKLITSDQDFEHLNQIFLEVHHLKPELLK